MRTDYGVPAARIAVVYNGVDLARFDPAHRPALGPPLRAALGVPPEARLCVAIGTGFARKGFDLLLALWREAPPPETVLLLVGDDERLPAWRRDAGALGGRAIVAGPRADVDAVLAAADVACVPSRQEAFGNVVLEACAAGVPPVVTRSRRGGRAPRRQSARAARGGRPGRSGRARRGARAGARRRRRGLRARRAHARGAASVGAAPGAGRGVARRRGGRGGPCSLSASPTFGSPRACRSRRSASPTRTRTGSSPIRRAVVVKLQRKVVVGRIGTRLGTVWVKRYNVFAARVALAGAFVPSPASRAWIAASRLAALGFATAEPIAAIEFRRAGMRMRSFLLTRHVAGGVPVDVRWAAIGAEPDRRRRREARTALTLALGDLFRRLHAAGVYHPDLKDANILVTGAPERPACVLLDLEDVRFGPVGRRRRVKNVVQLARTSGGGWDRPTGSASCACTSARRTTTPWPRLRGRWRGRRPGRTAAGPRRRLPVRRRRSPPRSSARTRRSASVAVSRASRGATRSSWSTAARTTAP